MFRSLGTSSTLYVFLWLIFLFACEPEKETIKEEKQPEQKFILHSPERTGITFANIIEDRPAMNIFMYQYYHNGAGVAAGDFDNDGLCDLYFVGNFGKNRIYKNLGNFQFQDLTDSSIASGSYGWNTGVCLVDINNDGLLDIYLSKSGDFEEELRKNELFINEGNFKFTEQASDYGLADAGYSNQASFFDYDLDGDLDCYVMNHPVLFDRNLNYEALKTISDPFGSDHLYENVNGKYRDVSKKAGLADNSIAYGLGLAISDFNLDGYPDIYIGNDFLEKDYFYLNQGNGRFEDVLEKAVRHTSNFSMGNDVADINNDGYPDLFVADMAAEDNYRSKTNMSGMAPEKFWKAVEDGFYYQYMINTLQLNNGDMTFSEISQMAGVDKTDWSWAPLFADLDNDGWKDLVVTNGLRKDSRNNDFIRKKKEALSKFNSMESEKQLQELKKLLDMMPRQKIPNYVYRNQADLTFRKMINEWSFQKPSFSNGAVYADLDNDGDLDLAINNIDDAAFIYENQVSTGNYLQLEFTGPAKNRSAQGLKVLLKSDGKKQVAEHYLSRGYLSSVQNRMHFGIGDVENVDELIIIWPDGKKELRNDVKANQLLKIKYSDATENSPNAEYVEKPKTFKLLNDEINLNVSHTESDFDDYEKQVLLPHEMSKQGPCLCVEDINGDGREDFVLGGAKGYPAKLMIQTDKDFIRLAQKSFDFDKDFEDTGCAFFDADNDGDKDLYIVSGSSEDGVSGPAYQDRLYMNDGKGSFTRPKNNLPKITISGSCVRPYDIDSDGDLDLFVGGSQIPERYPEPASSILLINEKGTFEYAAKEKTIALQDLGMVKDAKWMDYNEDGRTDLMIVGEWMPITFLIQDEKGVFSKAETIQNSLGWWNCISSGDLNGDGKEDYVLGNLGLNVKYKASIQEPFYVYSKDFDDNGSYDIVLSSTKGSSKFPVRGRQCSSEQLPEIKEKFPTYDLFAKATVEEIYSKEELESALKYEAVHFESSVLKSQGNTFVLESLPNYAQISASQDAILKDFDSDGDMDILLAGNIEEMEVETPRCDASYGILLLQENGKYKTSASDFSLNMSGNVRAIEMINMNNKEFILVARNNGQMSIIEPYNFDE